MIFWVGLTAVMVLGLLAADSVHSRAGRWIAKPLASSCFVAAAVAAGAPSTEYGRGLLVAFAFCWVGDMFLIPSSKKFFLASLGTFLLGHVAFAATFWARGFDPAWTVASLVGLMALAIPILRWVLPHVERKMVRPVLAYVTVISMMVALAAGGAAQGLGEGRGLTLLGAVAFYLSDLSVARDRFVAPGFFNLLWGLPLYYAAQLIFVWSISG